MTLFSKAYCFVIHQLEGRAVSIVLTQTETNKQVKFFLAAPNTIARLERHMNSLTDTLCEEFFNEMLTKEEQKLRKALQKEERRRIEEAAKLDEAERAAARRIEKEAEKARKKERFKQGQ